MLNNFSRLFCVISAALALSGCVIDGSESDVHTSTNPQTTKGLDWDNAPNMALGLIFNRNHKPCNECNGKGCIEEPSTDCKNKLCSECNGKGCIQIKPGQRVGEISIMTEKPDGSAEVTIRNVGRNNGVETGMIGTIANTGVKIEMTICYATSCRALIPASANPQNYKKGANVIFDVK